MEMISMQVGKDKYRVVKDGSWYRVQLNRKRIGSFLLLSEARKYMHEFADVRERRIEKERGFANE